MADKNSTFFNVEAEESIIVAFLSDYDEAARKVVGLSSQDFYDHDCANAFRAIQAIVERHEVVNLASFAESLKMIINSAASDVLVPKFTHIAHDVGTFSAKLTLTQNIGIVKSLAMRRNLFRILDNAKRSLQDSTLDAFGICDDTRQALRDLNLTGHVWHKMPDVLAETFNAIERRSKGEDKGIPSGIKLLDRMTTGFHKGELTIIGARPAVGKSAFAMHVALMAAQKGYKVGVVSREMTDVQYGLRIFARGTGIENNTLRTGALNDDDWALVADSMSRYSGLDVDFMFSTRYIEDLRMEVQNKVDAGELDLLVVDYLQLMQSKQKFRDDFLRIAKISKELKDMTVDLNIAVVALAQVGRSAQNQMPNMAELRGSGDIEQDADNIIFIHKPEDENDKWVNPEDRGLFEICKREGTQYIVLNVAKQRQGETGCVCVTFDPARMRYTSIIKE